MKTPSLVDIITRLNDYREMHLHAIMKEPLLVAIAEELRHGSPDGIGAALSDLAFHCMKTKNPRLWNLAGEYLIVGKKFSPKWHGDTACSIINYCVNTPMAEWTRAGLRASVKAEGNKISHPKLDEILVDLKLSGMFPAAKRGRKTGGKKASCA